MKPVRSLVLIASDNDIRLLSNDGVGKGLVEIRHLTRADLPDVDVEFSDKPPRVMHGEGTGHAAEPRHTEAELERDRMVRHALQSTAEEFAAGGYDRFYMTAPDKVLGLLRKGLPKPLKEALAGDKDKDLAKVALRDLPGHFADIASF